MAFFNQGLNIFSGFVLLWVSAINFAVADDTNSKQHTAHIVMSHSPDFIGSWLAENKTKQLPASKVEKVALDKQFFVAFLARGLKGNHADRYQFDVDWKLYKPDGTVMISETGYARGSGPVPKDPRFLLAYPTLFIVLEKTDPPGKYKLEAIVKDTVAKTSAVEVYPFEFRH